MKKALRLIPAVCTAALLFCACSSAPADPSSSENPMASPVEIEEMLNEEGVFTTEWGEIKYAYHIPELAADTRGAGEINQQIETDLMKDVQFSLLDMQENIEPYFHSVRWESYQNGPILSLVITAETMPMVTEYYTYNYDCETGEYLPYFDLLDQLKIDRGQFDEALTRSMAQLSDQLLYDFERDGFLATAELRAAGINAQNLGNSRIYLGEDGILYAAAEVYLPAGGGVFPHILAVNLQEEHQQDQTVSCEFIRADLTGQRVTLTFSDTGDADQYLKNKSEFDRPYSINGLYGVYTDLYIGVLGQDFFPYLFLADDQGRVSFCDLLQGIEAGNHFFAAGPLPGICDVVSFHQGTTAEGDAQTVYAHTKSGEEIDLSDAVFQVQHTFPSWSEDISWNTFDFKRSISFLKNEDHIQAVVYEDNPDANFMDITFTADVTYLGMDNLGMYYHIPLAETNPAYNSEEEYLQNGVHQMIMTVPCWLPGSSEFENNMISLHEVRGNGLWGIPPGETIELTQSYG